MKQVAALRIAGGDLDHRLRQAEGQPRAFGRRSGGQLREDQMRRQRVAVVERAHQRRAVLIGQQQAGEMDRFVGVFEEQRVQWCAPECVRTSHVRTVGEDKHEHGADVFLPGGGGVLRHIGTPNLAAVADSHDRVVNRRAPALIRRFELRPGLQQRDGPHQIAVEQRPVQRGPALGVAGIRIRPALREKPRQHRGLAHLLGCPAKVLIEYHRRQEEQRAQALEICARQVRPLRQQPEHRIAGR